MTPDTETLSPRPTEKPLPIPSFGGIRKAGPAPRGHPPAPRTPVCRPSSGSPERGSSSESASPSPGIPAAVRAPEAEGHGPLCPISECHNSPRASEVRRAPRGRCCARPPPWGRGEAAAGSRFSRCPEPGPWRAALTLRTEAGAELPGVLDYAGKSWRPPCCSRLQTRSVQRLLQRERASWGASASPAPAATELGVRAGGSGRGGSGLGREWSGSQPLAQPTEVRAPRQGRPEKMRTSESALESKRETGRARQTRRGEPAGGAGALGARGGEGTAAAQLGARGRMEKAPAQPGKFALQGKSTSRVSARRGRRVGRGTPARADPAGTNTTHVVALRERQTHMSRRPLEVILLGTPQFQAVSRYEAVWSGLAPRVLSTNPRRQQLRTALQNPHLLPAAAAAAEPGRSSAPSTVAPSSPELAPQAGDRARGESSPGPATEEDARAPLPASHRGLQRAPPALFPGRDCASLGRRRAAQRGGGRRGPQAWGGRPHLFPRAAGAQRGAGTREGRAVGEGARGCDERELCTRRFPMHLAPAAPARARARARALGMGGGERNRLRRSGRVGGRPSPAA
ncbi:serine/arginine repetitive matrix protein 2 [Desmodus rotundus]|uniref:serine/arginine repetitive matrix protein 2 n=1 Tax=Desmodus rotundus TaxID=9430 RepID=UPI0039E5A19B